MDGKEYIDAVSGIAVVNYGHNNRRIIEAVKEQLDQVTFSYPSQATTETTLKLLEKLMSLLPDSLGEGKVMLLNSGSEANDFALRAARLHHVAKGDKGKYRFIGRWISYHGATSCLSCTGHPLRRWPFEPQLLNFPMVEPPYCYRCPWKKEYPECDMECALAVEKCIKRSDPDTIAGFICEVIGGMSGGFLVPPREYYPMVKEVCEKYNVLFVDDEVINGLGRTGKMWAFQHYDFVPDIVTTAKGLGGGVVPISAMIASSKVIEPIYETNTRFDLYVTYGSNPVACSAALAGIEVLLQDNLVEKAASLGEYMLRKLKALEPDHKIIGDIRGKGLSIGVELVKDKSTKGMFKDQETPGKEVQQRAWEKGVRILGTKGPGGGLMSDFLALFPPLIISHRQIDKIVMVIDEALTEVERTL